MEFRKSRRSKSKKPTREKASKGSKPSRTDQTFLEETSLVTRAEKHSPSTEETISGEERPRSEHELHCRENEVKTALRSREKKLTFPCEIPSPQDGTSDPRSKMGNSEAQVHPPAERSKLKSSRKERKSKSDKSADPGDTSVTERKGSKLGTSRKERRTKSFKEEDLGDGTVPEGSTPTITRKERKSKLDVATELGGSVGQPERSKMRKFRMEHRSSVDDTAVMSAEGSKKKKKKKSRRKSEEIQPAKTCGTYGLSAMIEPRAFLEILAKEHRDEVHVLKDIMDLQAARTGDRSKLRELHKLLTRINKEEIRTPSETPSSSYEPTSFPLSSSVKISTREGHQQSH
ncbi:hypothetical protein R1flu_013841 [Riccia fluitans]|uniref:Uncharacterized protein n=1 Tax=Riccia fluitans TaxID=41844 RepID=A0ABD1YF48_9MARC